MERELIELWRQLLRILLPYLWHTFSNSDDIPCNLQLATSLSDFQYKTILLASGIMAKRGDSYAFKKNGIEGLQVALKDSLNIHVTRCQFQKGGKHEFWIAVGKPEFRNPIEQVKANPTIPESQSGNVLDENSRRFLQHLCDERITATEKPEEAIPATPLAVPPISTNADGDPINFKLDDNEHPLLLASI